MKWLFITLAVTFMVAPAMAGEDPYIAIVGNDAFAFKPFYFSPKHTQFLFDTEQLFGIPDVFGSQDPVNQYTRVGVSGGEQFRSQTLNNQAEVCDLTGTGVAPNFVDRGARNVVTRAGNAGFYEWWIRLPKKPSGEINVVIQCGVLKPNACAAYGYGSIALCAAETGERVGFGTCARQQVDPGVSPVNNTALPRVTAVAYPGPFNTAFTPFHLTAFKNPSAYTLAFDAGTAAMSNNLSSQVLDGSANARVVLKACMDKTVVTKLPVTGQINALGEPETDLEYGDMIWVRVDVPRQNSIDIYCHQQSVRLAGVGETAW